jgi:hypothetical protein
MLLDKTLGEILTLTHTSLFGIFQDLTSGESVGLESLFMKDSRLEGIGVLVIIIGIILMFNNQ